MWTAISLWLLSFTAVGFVNQPADLPPSHSIKPELYATGFEFAEGPALDDEGNLYVVNYRGNGKIGRIATDGTASVFCDLREQAPLPAEGRKAQANGLKIDSQGRLIVADSGGERVLRITPQPDGKKPKIEVLAETYQDKPLNAPNDVAIDPAGNVYFSDPGGSSAKKPVGSIYRIAADGRLTRLDTGLAFPNGLAVTPDQKNLCLAESGRYRLLIYDLTPDGRAENRRTLIDFPDKTEGEIVGGRHEPDGMIFDSAGRLYVAMWSGGVINVVDVASGKLLRQYDAGGSKATNCHFHDGWLYTTIAAKEAVFRLKLGVEGFDYRRKPQP